MDPVIGGALISLIPSLWNLIFGGDENKATQTTVTEQPFRGWQSPSLGLLDPVLLKAFLGNVGRLQGAGFPKGMQDLGIGGMTGDIFDLIGKEWPNIMKGYGGGQKTTGTEERNALSKRCEDHCRNDIVGKDAISYQNCFGQCMNTGGW